MATHPIVSDYDIVQAMTKYGGSFVQALAETMRCADPENFARLKDTFPETWREYAELARLQRARGA